MRLYGPDGPSATSLLPIGVNRVEGEFEKDDIVRIVAPNGEPIGVGASPVAAPGRAKRWGKKEEGRSSITTTYTSTDRKTINKRYRKPCN